ncbi:MAG: cytochrome c3 family protein [Coriobacteriales bacterium]|jgi:hypothetical protein|nr:cytochrome c3 family protein [Coriobacteriales bacterium]
MVKMRIRGARLWLGTVALVGLLALLALAACGVPTGQPLSVIHEQAGSWEATDVSDNTCLGCHDRTNIVDSTQNYDGQADVNIHEPPGGDHPAPGSCVSCHRAEEPPIMTCNQAGCHTYTLPQDWSAPE